MEDKNQDLYASGLLETLLQHAKDSPEVSEYLDYENKYLLKNIARNETVLDVGCGMGRHLRAIESRISTGVEIDIDESYIKETRLFPSGKIKYVNTNIKEFVPDNKFSLVICMYNTLGNMRDIELAIKSMLRCIAKNGKLIISVFSEESISPRMQMYKNMGLQNPAVLEECIVTDEGFWSAYFSYLQANKLIPGATVSKCTDIGWIVHYKHT